MTRQLTFGCILLDVFQPPQGVVVTIADQGRNCVQQAVHIADAGRIAHLALERIRPGKGKD